LQCLDLRQLKLSGGPAPHCKARWNLDVNGLRSRRDGIIHFWRKAWRIDNPFNVVRTSPSARHALSSVVPSILAVREWYWIRAIALATEGRSTLYARHPPRNVGSRYPADRRANADANRTESLHKAQESAQVQILNESSNSMTD